MAVSLKMLAFRSLEDARQTEAGLTTTPPRHDLWLRGGAAEMSPRSRLLLGNIPFLTTSEVYFRS